MADQKKSQEKARQILSEPPASQPINLRALVGLLPQGAQQAIAMTALPQILDKAGQAMTDVETSLFGDPRVTQASVPRPSTALALMVKNLGKLSHGFKAAAGKGGIFLKGPLGQKVALRPTNEGFLDLVTIGKGAAKSGKEAAVVAQEAADALKMTLRPVGGQVTSAGQKFLEKNIRAGRLVPTRSGILSTRPAPQHAEEVAEGLAEMWIKRLKLGGE